MLKRCVIFCAVILGLTACNLSAQALGNIVGTVTDPGRRLCARRDGYGYKRGNEVLPHFHNRG